MTADDKPTFAAKLRALSKDASPGPWEDYECDGPTGFKGTQAEYLRTTPDGFGSGCSAFGILEPSPNFGNVAHIGALYHNGRVRVEEERANAALIVALRNHADRLADLVERVGQYREATDAREDRHYDEDQSVEARAEFVRLCNAETDAYRAMLAALDALVADAPGAASGTESPPSGDGGGA